VRAVTEWLVAGLTAGTPGNAPCFLEDDFDRAKVTADVAAIAVRVSAAVLALAVCILARWTVDDEGL
jgi:hypothetical protein